MIYSTIIGYERYILNKMHIYAYKGGWCKGTDQFTGERFPFNFDKEIWYIHVVARFGFYI